jgi:hypothetical protein
LADGALLILTAATVVAYLTGTHSGARLALVIVSGCLVPGAAILTRVSADDVLEALALAIVLGLALEAVGALAMVWTGFWHPAAWALVVTSGAGLLLAQDLRHHRASMTRA